jgi:transketolase C-terminal domain/subunit
MYANNLNFCGKMLDNAAEKQISVVVLDPDLFTSTNISQYSQQVGKAISNAMMNNCYVVGFYCTSQSSHLYEVQRGLVSRFC